MTNSPDEVSSEFLDGQFASDLKPEKCEDDYRSEDHISIDLIDGIEITLI